MNPILQVILHMAIGACLALSFDRALDEKYGFAFLYLFMGVLLIAIDWLTWVYRLSS